jgi:parvulin-like peptidyl-prolyl isomerase
MRIRTAVAIVAGAAALAGCKGFKDALTAHTDVAAEAANKELSATRLGALLGNARIGIDPSKENAQIVAELWADYQRLGQAAAHNDSLANDVDAALKPIFDNMRVSMMIDTLRAKSPTTLNNPEAAYNAGVGGVISARHILLGFPTNAKGAPATQAQKDSVRAVAMKVLPQVTDANFVAMAKRYSTDPGSKDKGGLYTPFARTDMVPEFSAGVEAVKPGEINKNLIESQFGYHIIQRVPYSMVKTEYEQMFPRIAQNAADSVLTENLMKNADIEVKSSAPAAIKEALKNPGANKKNKTVVSTFKGGEMTVGNLVGWLDVMPAQTRGQILQFFPTAPDTQVTAFTKNLTMRQVLLHQADSAKIDVPAQEKTNLKGQFNNLVQQTWMQLGLSPKDLAEGKTEQDRERIAAEKVDTLLTRIMNGEAQPVMIQMPVKAALDVKYDAELNSAGIDRAVESARKVRASADSARMAQPSSVPLPGGAPGQGAAQPPATQPPAGTKKP